LNEEKQDPSDATLGECLVAYGSYHFDKGEMEKASKDYNQALEMRRDIYGEEADHDEIAECIFHLGRLARSEGNEAEAQEMFQESLDMYKKVFGEESQNAGKLEVEDEMSKKGKKAEGKKKKGSATKYKTEKIE
jgi:tetratricopeptide (TPR) repeat protein